MGQKKGISQTDSPIGGDDWADPSLTKVEDPVANKFASHEDPLIHGAHSSNGGTAPRTGFPKSVGFIIGNEFCERFSFYGMKAVLPLYLVNFLSLSENTSTAVIHTFISCAYFTPLLGGMLSDSILGKYKTILYLSLVYCVGIAIMCVTAVPGVTGTPPHWIGAVGGLFILAVGTGGIKPCVSAFGGDQFVGAQRNQLSKFFSYFYFTINLGSVLSILITPLLRSQVSCFGMDECYPLAFGVPAVLLLVATLLFWLGRGGYRMVPPQGNIVIQIFRVIRVARSGRPTTDGDDDAAGAVDNLPPSPATGLDWPYAAHIFGQQLVNDVKAVFEVLIMFLPVPLFWTLFDQQGSRWIYQGERMGTEISFFGLTSFSIQPDQMMVCNALMILLLIPLFEYAVYPAFERCGMRLRPLARMSCGMVLCAAAFVAAGFLQIRINTANSTYNDDNVCTDNCVSILWQVPQYFLITCGEVMFSITGLEFAYSQAPESMKSVCQSAWLLTVAVGNIFVIVIAESQVFSSRVLEFFFFASLLGLVLVIFVLLSCKYTYIEDLPGSLYRQQSIHLDYDSDDIEPGDNDDDEEETDSDSEHVALLHS